MVSKREKGGIDAQIDAQKQSVTGESSDNPLQGPIRMSSEAELMKGAWGAIDWRVWYSAFLIFCSIDE